MKSLVIRDACIRTLKGSLKKSHWGQHQKKIIFLLPNFPSDYDFCSAFVPYQNYSGKTVDVNIFSMIQLVI